MFAHVFTILTYICAFLFTVEEQHQIVLKEEYIEVLREISRSIRPGERHKLAKEYIGEKEDDIKQIYDKDGTMLLAAMIFRKIETSKALIDCGMSTHCVRLICS